MDGTKDEAIKIAEFCKKIGSPITLEEMGYGEISEDSLEKVINKSMYREETMWNLPYKVDFNRVKEAILEANSLLKGE